jgi:hypothetical protein
MELAKVIVAAAMCMTVAMARRPGISASVTGSVTPPEGAYHAFLYTSKDTVATNIVNGNFLFSGMKAGNYNLLIQANPPYQNLVREGVRVVDGDALNLGRFELQK